MRKRKRVMIFIDGANVYHLIRDNFGVQDEYGKRKLPAFDYAKFCDFLCGEKNRLIHSHFYIVPVNREENPEEYDKQQRFFGHLSQIPYFSIHKGRLVKRQREIKCLSCKQPFKWEYKTEKGVDVSLAVHMLMYAFDNAYDIAILVSADGDFVTAVQEVKRLRKIVINATLEQYRGHFLARTCNEFMPITKDFLEKCLMK